jgi:hypothetical protein
MSLTTCEGRGEYGHTTDILVTLDQITLLYTPETTVTYSSQLESSQSPPSQQLHLLLVP